MNAFQLLARTKPILFVGVVTTWIAAAATASAQATPPNPLPKNGIMNVRDVTGGSWTPSTSNPVVAGKPHDHQRRHEDGFIRGPTIEDGNVLAVRDRVEGASWARDRDVGDEAKVGVSANRSVSVSWTYVGTKTPVVRFKSAQGEIQSEANLIQGKCSASAQGFVRMWSSLLNGHRTEQSLMAAVDGSTASTKPSEVGLTLKVEYIAGVATEIVVHEGLGIYPDSGSYTMSEWEVVSRQFDLDHKTRGDLSAWANGTATEWVAEARSSIAGTLWTYVELDERDPDADQTGSEGTTSGGSASDGE